MYRNTLARIRSNGALLLILVFGLLPMLSRADQAIVDDRVLRVQDGAALRTDGVCPRL